MNIAIFMSVFAPFLWAITNYIDKYMLNGIDNDTSNVRVLLVFSTLVAGIILSPFWFILSGGNISISVISLISVLVGSFVYILATYLYFKALDNNDTSIVVAIFQLIPVFSYAFGLILFNESMSFRHITGSIIIILSSCLISYDFSEKKNNKNRAKALLLMTFSSFLYSLYFILFDISIRNSSYYSCAFWYQIGFFLLGLLFISIKVFRNDFIKALKINGRKYIFFNSLNEVLNLIANLFVNFANLTLPIAFVNILGGFQGVFTFMIGFIGSLLLPKIFTDNFSLHDIIQKVSCIVVGLIGLIILFT